jgi:hypothetical protein
VSLSLAEIANRILAALTIATQAAMAHFGDFKSADFFSAEDSWQKQIKDSYFVKHPAGGNS